MASERKGKKPRGIRFTDEGYARLQKACELSDFSHLDDFILDMLKAKAGKVRMDALLRKIQESISKGTKETLNGVKELLDQYTR